MATDPRNILALPVVTLRDWLASGALRATELADAQRDDGQGKDVLWTSCHRPPLAV